MRSLDELSQLFESQRQSSRLHHAWILEGVSDDITTPWLEEVIPELVGGKLGDGHFHPNVFWLNAVDVHNIDAVRRAISFLEKTSWDGGWKVCVIAGADQLNPQAQNALLKMMEDPPKHTIIFLTSEHVRLLLPTIYSRGLHMILSDHGVGLTLEFEQLKEEWLTAVVDILSQRQYEKLFALQKKLTDESIDPESQTKLVISSLKDIIDASKGLLPDVGSSVQQLLRIVPVDDWLRRWERVQKYLADAVFFDVDQKQFCVKLTTKILQ